MFFYLILLILTFPFNIYAQSTTVEPTVTSTPILTPTPTVWLNPSSGIYLNEFMPNPNDNNEWVEIINSNNIGVKIEGWKIGDNSSSTRQIDVTEIPPGGLYSFFIGSSFLNNSTDSIRLINNLGVDVESYAYPSVKDGQSWSKVNNNWCLTVPSKGLINSSCYVPSPTSPPPTSSSSLPTSPPPTITPTPKLTSTPVPTSTPKTTTAPTATIKLTPTEPILTPSIEPTLSLSDIESAEVNDPILGIGDIIKPTPTPNITGLPTKVSQLLPVLFIISGGILMLTPLIISKINK